MVYKYKHYCETAPNHQCLSLTTHSREIAKFVSQSPISLLSGFGLFFVLHKSQPLYM